MLICSLYWNHGPSFWLLQAFHAVSDSPWDIKNPSNFSAPCFVLGTCGSWYSSSKHVAPEVSMSAKVGPQNSFTKLDKTLNSPVVVSLLTVNQLISLWLNYNASKLILWDKLQLQVLRLDFLRLSNLRCFQDICEGNCFGRIQN